MEQQLAQPAEVEATARPTATDFAELGRVLPRAVRPQEVPPDTPLNDPTLYLNRELGWVDFNWRVLALAQNEDVPLLERVRFVAITASNLDEFVQKRVGGLKRQEAAGVSSLSRDGRTPSEQLVMLRESIGVMHEIMTATWEQMLRPILRERIGVAICDYEELSPRQRAALHDYFQREIYPILTPLAVDPGRPFPFISNLSLSIAVSVRYPRSDSLYFVRLKIPVSRWIPVPEDEEGRTAGSRQRFLPAEQLIAKHIHELLPGMEVVAAHPFRVTRNADLRRDEEEAEDLLEMISEEVRERRFAPVVRLEVAADMPEYQRQLILDGLEIQPEDVYEVEGLIDLTACYHLANLPLPQHQYPHWEPEVPARLLPGGGNSGRQNIFATLRQGDLLIHHPYESFAATTQLLIEEAALDPHVIAIKQTVYRTSDRSPIINALMRAGERGKQVAVLVEVKARFDEANNIEWGRMLENSGVHVAYGLVGLKTHTKATLIVRREPDGLRTYCHIGTGNYNSKTARLYTDLGLLTCDPAIGRDLVNLFHFLTAYAPERRYEKALVAPKYMRTRFYDLIDHEIAVHREFGNGHIMAKMNALDDPGIIQKLYQASQAGVRIDLIIRGHCALRPGLPGYSDNIHVTSILGRFLEHDRIYYFHNNGEPLTFIGSADWRTRNLNSRVELIVPIDKPVLKQQLIGTLRTALADNQLAWKMDSSGAYSRVMPGPNELPLNFQEYLMERATRHP